jgi:tetratricopeptide (TPR) repeat protein/transcriptional regulator with XRE-family HTH domain
LVASQSGSRPPTSGPALAGLVRAWRERAMLSQEQLAERTGLGVRTIRRLESGGLRRPRSVSLRLLAAGLDLDEGEREQLREAALGEAADPEPAEAAPPPVPSVPHQLPADVAGFTGRARHLRRLDALLGGAGGHGPVLIAAITGTAGVGKTALSVHWARRAAGRFPDGQLFVNLRGHAPGEPVAPLHALSLLLQGLGRPGSEIPASLDAASGLYRSLLAGRRLLVLLDNARDAEQVRPLLPGEPGCLVVVTSRDRLSGLVASHGASPIHLDVLEPAESLALLSQIVGGERVAAEPGGATEMADLCGHLPLALRIAAADLAGTPDRAIADHAAALRAGDRLAGLEIEADPQASVRAAFDCSYAALDPDARRLFRMLGLVPGPDFDAPALAALAGMPADHAERPLARLVGVHLLEARASGRYAFHDLLRRYAHERTLAEDCDEERAAAMRRLLAWYVRRAGAAASRLYPHILRLPAAAGEPDAVPAEPAELDERDALAWLDAERHNLFAAVAYAAEHGPQPLACLLADSLRGYLVHRRVVADWLAVAGAGLAAATAAGDLRAEAAALLSLAQANWNLGRYPEAMECYAASLRQARDAGWLDGEATVLNNLGNANLELGNHHEAADQYTAALALHRRTGRAGGQATSLINLGNVERELGRLVQAAEHGRQALALLRQMGARGPEAAALVHLGEVLHQLGQLEASHQHLVEARALHTQQGNRAGEASALHALAALQGTAGRTDQAVESGEAAVALAREIGDRCAEADALNALGAAHLRAGRVRRAGEQFRLAQAVARQAGFRYPEACAVLGLAATALAESRPDRTIALTEQALAMAARTGYRILEGHGRGILAAAHLRREEPDQAAEMARRALAVHRETGHRLGQARALVSLARAELRLGAAGAAGAAWDEALAIYREAGVPEANELSASLVAG